MGDNKSNSSAENRLLGTSVCHASSEDESFPASELNQAAGNAPHMAPRGWQSAKLGDFPQEIGLRFESGEAFVQQIQILAHQSKTPTRVDIFVYPPPNKGNNVAVSSAAAAEESVGGLLASASGGGPPPYHDVPFHRLGYVTFRNNEATKYRTRERKSVQLNVKAVYLRLVLHKCYSNPVNLYSQVGIVALTAWGKPMGGGLLQQQQQQQHPAALPRSMSRPPGHNSTQGPSASGGGGGGASSYEQPPVLRSGANNNMSSNNANNSMQHQQHANMLTDRGGSQTAALAAMQAASVQIQSAGTGPLGPVAPPPTHSRSMTRFSHWYSEAFSSLNDAKTRAVETEDFELAKNVKERLAWLAAQAAEINLMDSQKCALADAEDYNGAQQLHVRQSHRIDNVIRLSQSVSVDDSVANMNAQMNELEGSMMQQQQRAADSGAGTPVQGGRRNTPGGKKNNRSSKRDQSPSSSSGLPPPSNNSMQQQQQQHQMDQQHGGTMTPGGSQQQHQHEEAFMTSPDISAVGGSHQQAGRKSNSPSPSGGGSGGGGAGPSPNRHSFEDQPIRSKFAIEMAQMRMQQQAAKADESSSGTGGTAADSIDPNVSDLGLPADGNTSSSGAAGGSEEAGGGKPPKASRRTPTKQHPKNHRRSSSQGSDASSEGVGTSNRNGLDGDEDEKSHGNNGSDGDESEKHHHGGSKDDDDDDHDEGTRADDQSSLPPSIQMDGWEREILRLVEETASARFVSTAGPEDGEAAPANSSSQQQQQAPSSALQQQQRAENAGAASAGLHFAFGKYAAGCLFSRRWVMRESALCTIVQNIDTFAKHTKKSPTEVVEALLLYIDTKGFGLLDHVPSIFGVCRDFIMKVLSAGEDGGGGGDGDEDNAHYSQVSLQHVSGRVAALMPRLLLKACEGAGKVRDEAAALILALAGCPAIGPHAILPFLICTPVDADKKNVKTVTAKHLSTRLTLLQLIYNFAYEDVDLSGTPVKSLASDGVGGSGPIDNHAMYPAAVGSYDQLLNKLLVPCANHSSSEVRDAAVSILCHMLLHAAGIDTLKGKVPATLRKITNPAAKATLTSVVAPAKPAEEGGDGRTLTPTDAAGDGSTDLSAGGAHPPRHHHGAGSGAAGRRPGPAGKRPAAAARGGRVSTTPQPGDAGARTPGHRGTPSSGMADRRSNTPTSGKPVGTSAAAHREAAAAAAPSNTHPLPALAGDAAGAAGVGTGGGGPGARKVGGGVVGTGVSPGRGRAVAGGGSPGSHHHHHQPAAPASNRTAGAVAARNRQLKARRVSGQHQQQPHGAANVPSVVGSAMAQ